MLHKVVCCPDGSYGFSCLCSGSCSTCSYSGSSVSATTYPTGFPIRYPTAPTRYPTEFPTPYHTAVAITSTQVDAAPTPTHTTMVAEPPTGSGSGDGGIGGGVNAGAAIGSLPAVWGIVEATSVYAAKKRPSVGSSERALLSASTITTTRKLLDSNVSTRTP